MPAFHVKDGLYFERLEDGTVLLTTPPINGTGESFEIEPSAWASVVASVTPEGETHANFFLIEALHRGEFGQDYLRGRPRATPAPDSARGTPDPQALRDTLRDLGERGWPPRG